MKNWREEFKKKFVRQNLRNSEYEDGWFLIESITGKSMKAFISLTLTEAFKELEEGLPKERYVEKHICNQKEWCLIPECNYNKCLAEVKESLKILKRNFYE